MDPASNCCQLSLVDGILLLAAQHTDKDQLSFNPADQIASEQLGFFLSHHRRKSPQLDRFTRLRWF